LVHELLDMSIISGDTPVTGYFPFLNFEENFILKDGLNYDGIVSTLCKEIAVNANNIGLTRVDKMGWHTTIVKERPRLDIELGIIDILPNSCIAICKLRDNVGPRKYIKSLSAHSDQTRVSELMNNYCGWRTIKGDGNCYYRAVYFSLFEQIIVRRQYRLFGKLRDKFSSIHFDDEADQEEHEEFLEILATQTSGKPSWGSVADFEYEVLNTDSVVDEACVRACRRLVSAYVIKNQDVVMNGSGITIKDAISPSYKDVK
jgi:hypothetical protein